MRRQEPGKGMAGGSSSQGGPPGADSTWSQAEDNVDTFFPSLFVPAVEGSIPGGPCGQNPQYVIDQRQSNHGRSHDSTFRGRELKPALVFRTAEI